MSIPQNVTPVTCARAAIGLWFPPMVKLSPREMQVAHLAAQGWPKLLIAAALRLHERTVRHHLVDICRKLSLASACELPLFSERLAPAPRRTAPRRTAGRREHDESARKHATASSSWL